MSRYFLLFLLASSFLGSACGADTDGVSEHCNPLGDETNCLMPWPSAVYLEDDSTTVTGRRVVLPEAGMPTSLDLRVVSPSLFAHYDGFGIANPILAAWPTGVSAEGLPGHRDPSESMAPNASVVVINMETGERLTIFAEPDMTQVTPESRALIIRPLERMRSNTRYAVGIRKSVKAADGSDLPIAPAFQALVDGTTYKHPFMDKLEASMPEVFSALEATGVPRDDLVLAWDFYTASDEAFTRDILTIRDDALPRMGDLAQNLSYTITEDRTNAGDNVYKFYNGTYETPYYLTQDEDDESILSRDSAGTPQFVKIGQANFSVLIPKCVETAPGPVPAMMFGHGIFGNAADSLDDGFLKQVADQFCVVFFGTDYIGLTDRQLVAVAFAMNDLNRTLEITEKLEQSVVNWIALQRVLRGKMANGPEFQLNGQPIIDPSRVYYYGASLGGNMGGVYMSYDPDILQGIMGVAGGPWSLMFERSVAWPALQSAMKGAYTNNPYDYQLAVSQVGLLFEKVDPVTISSRVIADPLPGTPAKQLLVYYGIADSYVSNIASETLLRSLNLPVTGPSLVLPWATEETMVPVSSAMTIYDEHVSPIPPETNVAPLDDNGTHYDVNTRQAVQRQIQNFINTGMIQHECQVDGSLAPCDCSTGACD